MRTSRSKLILRDRFICAAAWHEIRIQALHDDSPFKKDEEAWHDQFTSYTLPSNGTTYQVTKTWAPSRYMNTGCRDDRLETMFIPQMVVWIQPTVKKYFREPSVGTVSIITRYRVSFSKALVPLLQLWHLHWLQSVHSGATCIRNCNRWCTSRLAETLLRSSTRKRLDDVDQDIVGLIPCIADPSVS